MHLKYEVDKMDLKLRESTKEKPHLSARGRMTPTFIHVLSPKAELVHKKNTILKSRLLYNTDLYRKGKVDQELESIRARYRGVCSVAPVCPPGRSPVHRPRGPRSPTATSAGSASGSSARCCRTGPMPGLPSPAGRPCVDETTDGLQTR